MIDRKVHSGFVRPPAEPNADDIKASVNEFLETNPVTPGASAEEAAQIKLNTENIEKLQTLSEGLDTVVISDSAPNTDNKCLWIQSGQYESFDLPQINDETVSEEDTWSSKKISDELNTQVSQLSEETTNLKSDLVKVTESEDKLEVSNYPEGYIEWDQRGLANQYTNMPQVCKIVIRAKVDVVEEFKLIVFDRFENVEFVGLRPTDIYHEINVTPTETGEQDLEFVLPTEISGHFYVALQLVSETQNKLVITNKKYSDKLQDAYSTNATGDTPRWFQASMYYLCIKMYTKTFSVIDRKSRNDIEGLDTRLNDLEKAIPPKKHTRVILNFEQEDTVPSEYYLERQKLLESYGFKGSFALSNLFFEGDGLDSEQISRVIDLQNSGHDISLRGGVGGRPSDLDDTSEANQLLWDNYINGAINRAENIGVFNMVGYQCMNNVIGDALYNSLKKAGFKYARVYRTDKYGNDGTDYIKVYTEDGSMSVVNCFGFVNTTGFDSIKKRIDTAVQNGWDLCLMSHNISDNPTYEQTLKSVYIQALDYLKTLHDNGTVDVVTWHELYQQDNYEKSNDFDYNRIVKKLNWLQIK